MCARTGPTHSSATSKEMQTCSCLALLDAAQVDALAALLEAEGKPGLHALTSDHMAHVGAAGMRRPAVRCTQLLCAAVCTTGC